MYRTTIIIIVCLSLHLCAATQVEVFPRQLVFGTTTPQTNWVVDIIIKNNSAKKDFLLRTTFSHEYDVLATTQTLLPDSSMVLRVKFKPRKKGPFKENIEFHFASMDKPIIFPVSADVQYLNPDDHLACPDFSRLAADCCPNNTFVVEVVNAETKEPVMDARVLITEAGIQQIRLSTNSEGRAGQAIPIGYYGLSASHKDYLPQQVTSYINNRNAYFRFELQPIKNEIIEEPLAEETSPADSIVSSPDYILPESQFRPNNIVFLLDASTSMSTGGRLELMRQAVNELVRVLRPMDKITVISYNDQSKVLMATTTGDHRDEVTRIVNEMAADGNTAGEKGFGTAYKMLKDEFIPDGNNQLIVVTDGAFQPGDQEKIDKLVKKSVRRKLVTSIVGIRANTYAARNLAEVSATGGGSFVEISDEEDLHLIIEEIKKQSAR